MSSERQREADSSATPGARRVGTRFHPRGLRIPPRGRCEHFYVEPHRSHPAEEVAISRLDA